MEGIQMSDHIPDLTKMIQDTPRTDAVYFKPDATMYDLAGEMKRIERELNAANDRIKRLVQAGDCLLSHRNSTDYHEKVREWDKAKKDKP
jgi:predicted  nucleic acid-binding Zn-ribbon protein